MIRKLIGLTLPKPSTSKFKLVYERQLDLLNARIFQAETIFYVELFDGRTQEEQRVTAMTLPDAQRLCDSWLANLSRYYRIPV